MLGRSGTGGGALAAAAGRGWDAAPGAGGGGAAAPSPASLLLPRGPGDGPACPGFASENRHVVPRVSPERRSLVAVAF